MQAYDFEVVIPPITARAVPRDDGKYVLRSEIPQRVIQRGGVIRPGTGDPFGPAIAAVAKYKNIGGIMANLRWAEIERTPGVYDWSRTDELVNACVANKVRPSLWLDRKAFNKLSILPCPADVKPVVNGPDQIAAPIDNLVVRQRWYGLIRAVIARYDGKLAYLVLSESAPGPNIKGTALLQAWLDAIIGEYEALSAAKLTQPLASINSFGNKQERTLIDAAVKYGLGHYSSDCFDSIAWEDYASVIPRPRVAELSFDSVNRAKPKTPDAGVSWADLHQVDMLSWSMVAPGFDASVVR